MLDSAKAVEALLQHARQMRFRGGSKAALPLVAQALEIAKGSGEKRLSRIAHASMANCLLTCDRSIEAEQHLRSMGQIGIRDDASIRAAFHYNNGILAALRGRALEAFDHFEDAVGIAKDDSDAFQVAHMWGVYGNYATLLGNIELARSCYERALFVARRYSTAWHIVHINLEYAEILKLSGEYEIAHERLQEALSCDVSVPVVDASVVEVGIPLSLYMNDQQMLAKCIRESAIDYAFRSGESTRIGPVSAAFANWYVTEGRVKEARRLLQRGLRTMKVIRTWDFPIAVARYGREEDVPTARTLLEQLATRMNSGVARACLVLFDAFSAYRFGQGSEAGVLAQEARKRLDILGFQWYADMARSLHPGPKDVVGGLDGRDYSQRRMLPELTPRERQVAELVLRGLSNREIAERLSISKYTVESHVASIMARLGIRSRHQLVHFQPPEQ